VLTKEKQIADWLNGTSGEPAARKRVIQLVRDVRALAAAERMRFQIPSPEGFKWAKEAGLSGGDTFTRADAGIEATRHWPDGCVRPSHV
jgi:hypothetical protein